jgi:putative sigma-54 modulation protein
MEITIKAIHFDATEKLEAFIEKKVGKLEKFHDGIISAEVLLKVVKPETSKNKNAAIRIKIRNGECFADKTSDTFEEAIDTAVEALEKQLLKAKEKSREKS